MIQYIMVGHDDNATRWNTRYSNMQVSYAAGANSGNPRTCDEVPNDGLYNLDPEQDGLDPISVFCNTSSTPATAVLHHNVENWTLVQGYESSGSYTAQVRFGQMEQLSLSILSPRVKFWCFTQLLTDIEFGCGNS